jgi:hypothetical protein
MSGILINTSLEGTVHLRAQENSANAVVHLPAGTDTIVARNSTDTLTNKTLVSPVITGVAGSSATGALTIPAGTSAQRPTGADGMIRMNSALGRPEYFSAIMNLWIPFSSSGGTPNIGDPYGGGYFGGYISSTTNGIATHMIIVSPKTSGEFAGQWRTTDTAITGADSLWDGWQNTLDMVAAGDCPIATTARALSIGGYTDWYVPARDELEVLYYNLKNVSQANYIAGGNLGVNPSAVPVGRPVSTAYTAARPSQTGLVAWQVGGSEAFADYLFWSSSEASATLAWLQYFYSGNPGLQNHLDKTTTSYVRAVRRLAI